MPDKRHRQTLESALNTFLYNYMFEVVNPRLEAFSKEYYKSPWEMFKRHFKNDLFDLLISLNNLLSWISGRLFKTKDFSRTSKSEKELLEKFTQDVFCVELLQSKLQLFLDQFLMQEIQEDEAKKEKLLACTQEWKDEIALKALQVTHLKRLSTKASSFLIDMSISTGIVGEMSRGLGALIGSLAAKELYMSQQNLFYYWWYTFTGMPTWVELTGGIIGAVVAVILFVPVVGTLIEYLMQPFNDTAKQIREAYPELISRLIYGDDKDKRSGLMELSVKYLDGCTQLLDGLRQVIRAI